MDFFVSIETLKSKSLIHGNVDTKTLRVILERTQPTQLKSLLGKATYDDLLAKFKTGGTGGDAVEQEFYDDWLLPYLIIRTEEMAVVHFNWEIRNKNVGIATDEHSNGTTMKDNAQLVDQFKRQAGFYHSGAIKFLKDNLDTFTLYKSECEDVDKDNGSFDLDWGAAKRRV